MNIKSFKAFKSVFKRNSVKSDSKEGEKTQNKDKNTRKKGGFPSILNKITRPLIDIMSKYSVEQEDIVGLDITPKNVRVAQLNNIKNKWILEKLAYKFVEIPKEDRCMKCEKIASKFTSYV